MISAFRRRPCHSKDHSGKRLLLHEPFHEWRVAARYPFFLLLVLVPKWPLNLGPTPINFNSTKFTILSTPPPLLLKIICTIDLILNYQIFLSIKIKNVYLLDQGPWLSLSLSLSLSTNFLTFFITCLFLSLSLSRK